MKNRLIHILYIFMFAYLLSINAYAKDIFNFNVSELEIIEKGNKFIGKNGGTVTSEDGVVIKAKNFEYDKLKNILVAFGDVEIIDDKESIIIKSQKVSYLKKDELIFTSGKSKAFYDGIIIDAHNFEYDKIKKLINAYGKVKIDNKDENYLIYADEATYQKNKELFLIKGNSKAINEGIVIEAENFELNKIENVINANGKVKIDNQDENYLIYSDDATYLKKDEIFLTKGRSKVINEDVVIYADNLEYNKVNNTINASNNVKIDNQDENFLIYADNAKYLKNDQLFVTKGNVKIEDTINKYLILTNKATYYKSSEKIITEGDTEADIESKYFITSKDVTYLHNEKIISSKRKTKLQDYKSQVYFADRFNYSINEEIIEGENFLIITNYNLPKSDKFFLDSATVDLRQNKFIAKNTKIEVHKDVFGNSENDPRIIGASSSGGKDYTLINKGVFTSCKKNDDCPPWSIESELIKHDKIQKTINYDNAVLKIYDIPVFYFPKFFHPDPSVKRQSGLIKPAINNSNILGTSVSLPYFKVISESKDLTLTPTLFENDTFMSTAEYRQENENSTFLADFGFVNGYKSSTTKKKNSLSHFFLEYDLDLKLENYNSSNLKMSISQVSNDSYLNVFDQYITKSNLRPNDFNKLSNEIKLSLDHDNYNFQAGFQGFENLQIEKQSDRYQYVLPYYNFDRQIVQKYFNGSLFFNSNGNNVLDDTNKLEANVINNLSYNSLEYISNLGIKKTFGINIKNLNSIGNKTSKYKSSPQIELVSLYNADISFPLIKTEKNTKNFLTPKLSFRYNPSDMKNYTTSERIIDANNAFAINRLGLTDTLEAGSSLTLGLDFKKEHKNNLEQINKYFELKLATIIREKEEKFIPTKSTINRKNSNLFGSITNKFSENIKVDYNFSLDNDFNTLDYNDINTSLSINNLVTQFNFIEENGGRGDSNILATSLSYELDKNNYLSFDTRRNRKLNLTEFYDLIYEYKNDCLKAGVKYKKTYYSDGDLKPTENLLFTLTLFPVTTYEHDVRDLLIN